MFCFSGGAGDREKMPVNHEAFLLMANSQNEMEDWVKAIRRVIWAPFGGGIANSSHAHKLKHLPQGKTYSCDIRIRVTL